MKRNKTSRTASKSDAPKLLNPENKPLSPDKLRELTGRSFSDEQAEKAISAIRLFAKVLFGLLKRQHTNIPNKAEVIRINNTKKQAA